MGFDLEALKKAELEARTSEVRADSLKDWFAEGDEPVFTVRGLYGQEMAQVREAVDKHKNVQDLVQAIATADQGTQERIQAIREAAGVTTGMPTELVRRIEALKRGSVDPEIDEEGAKKIAKGYSIDFFKITDEIMRLTGQGAQEVKKNNSSRTPTSDAA
mgnify:CR=1 FL=1